MHNKTIRKNEMTKTMILNASHPSHIRATS